MYINDLPEVEDGIEMFADDTSKVLKASNNRELETTAKCSIDKLQKWFIPNNLLSFP